MKRIGEDVAQELTRLGPQGAIGAIVEAWPQAVGDTIARNAWPARIGRDRTLHVAAASSAWAFELTQLAAEILARLRASLAADVVPRALRFAPGRLPEPSSPSPSAASDRAANVAEPTPEEHELATRLASEIEDGELRAVVARAAAASLARSPESPARATAPTGTSDRLRGPASR
jgi:hypothetical protein